MKKFTMLFVLVLFIKIAVGQVTVTITVMNNLSPSAAVSGASVTLTGAATPTVISDANGLATFSVPTPAVDAYYNLAITADGYINFSSDWDVYITTTDVTINNTVYIKAAYSAQFTITDGTNPIPNANIRLVSTWPAFDQTFITDAQGVLLTDKLFPSWTSLNYTISASGFADSTGSVFLEQTDLIVDPVALKRAYNITFTIDDGTNPVSEAAITINNNVVNTDISGIAVFPKMINGDYTYTISKPGYGDITGTVTVTDANAAKTVSLAMGYNLTFNVINGPDGTTGLANDTITINGITKATDANGTVIFGVAPNSAVSFVNKKAGFIDVPVDIANVSADMTYTINMVPVYNVVLRAMDGNSYNPIPGATVVFNGITATTDVDGFATFAVIAPSTDSYAYSVAGNGNYNTVTGEINLPFTSTEEYLATNNVVSKTEYLTSPAVTIALVNGWMNYFGAATINFDGTDYEYNPGLGFNTFTCALGTHTFVVTPEDVTKAILRGTVVLTELEQSVYLPVDVVNGRMVEIFVVDKNIEPIEGAEVNLNGIALSTDASGEAMFMRFVPGNYTYTISKAGYLSTTSPISVNDVDVLVVDTLFIPGYSITFNVSDGTSAIANAIVTVGMTTVFTGVDGKAVFTGLPPAVYTYMVTAGGYDTISSSTTVADADLAENVTMKLTVYSLTLTITDGSAVVQNASVTVGTTTMVTGADGNAVFTDLLPGDYTYAVTATGFAPANGTATITNVNAVKNIVLLSDVGLNLSRNGAINVYPNPTKGNLSVNLPANSGKGITISVTNAIGKVVFQKKVVDSSTGLDLDFSGFDNGIYFVKVIGSGIQNTVKVVKN